MAKSAKQYCSSQGVIEQVQSSFDVVQTTTETFTEDWIRDPALVRIKTAHLSKMHQSPSLSIVDWKIWTSSWLLIFIVIGYIWSKSLREKEKTRSCVGTSREFSGRKPLVTHEIWREQRNNKMTHFIMLTYILVLWNIRNHGTSAWSPDCFLLYQFRSQITIKINNFFQIYICVNTIYQIYIFFLYFMMIEEYMEKYSDPRGERMFLACNVLLMTSSINFCTFSETA